MLCANCGTENQDENLFCNKCGAKLEEKDVEAVDNNKINKKKILLKIVSKIPIENKTFIITIISVLIVALVTGSFYSNNKDFYKFKSLFNDQKYSQAQKYYSDAVKNQSKSKRQRLDNSIKKYFANKAKKIKENYSKDTKRYEASNELYIFSNMAFYNVANNEINPIKAYIINIRDSRYSYYKGNEALKNNDYNTAILNFKKVAKDDNNYKKAQNKVKEVLPKLKKHQIELAEKLFQFKDYASAITSLETISQYLGNDKELNEKLSLYKSEKEKQEKLVVQQKESRKNELLAIVTKYTDQVSNEVTYSHKPYGDKIQIPVNGVVFYPYLRGEIGSDVLKLIVGFNRKDWIFMDKIVCNADGTTFDINFGRFDRKSDVGFGTGVYEWVEIPLLDAGSIITNINPSLSDNLNKLGKASNASIKFQGDTKAFDYMLTQQQKDTLLNIIELHNVSKH